jgi:hypothetical protein
MASTSSEKPVKQHTEKNFVVMLLMKKLYKLMEKWQEEQKMLDMGMNKAHFYGAMIVPEQTTDEGMNILQKQIDSLATHIETYKKNPNLLYQAYMNRLKEGKDYAKTMIDDLAKEIKKYAKKKVKKQFKDLPLLYRKKK